MPDFPELDKPLFTEMVFPSPPDDERADEAAPTQEELQGIEEELDQWEKLMNSPLGRAIKLFLRSQKAEFVSLVMTPVALLAPQFPLGIIQRMKDEAVGAYQVWDFLEKRPRELLERKTSLEKGEAKVSPRKKALTKRKKVG